MNKKDITDIIIRYLILAILGLFIGVFYKVFTPLTVYPSSWILNIFYDAVVVGDHIIYFNGIYAEIIEACVAGSAYYLLLILNLSTKISMKRRIYDLLFLFGLFLVLNVIRIVIFAILYSSGFAYFDLAHGVFWYFGSTIMVVGIWFFGVYLFRIKRIPIYSDFLRVKKSIK